MPLIRYEVTLSDDARRYPTAFAPVPASTIARWSNRAAQGQTQVGQPGTQRIAAPYADVGPSARPGSPLPGGSGGGMAGGSRYADPFWMPSLYYARQELWGGIGGVMVYSDNAPPVPTQQATGTTQVPGMKPRRPQWLWGRQMAEPPNTPLFKRWHGKHARGSVTTRG